MQWIRSIFPISFPKLGISINPHEGITIGPLTIYFYGLILGIGLLLACIYGLRRRKEFGLTEDDVLDGVLWIVPFAFVCARIYYCVFAWDEFKADPISVLYVWKGGIAIYGGVIGAAIGILVYCRVKKLPLATALDITAVSFLIGQAIGRWGNFINREAFGAYCDNFLAMRLPAGVLSVGSNSTAQFRESVNLLQTKAIEGGYVGYYQVHPTFLYESLWNAVGFVILHVVSKRRKYDGQVALGYVAWYGLGRTFIEGLRMDSLYLGSIRFSQLLAAVSCLAAVTVLVIMSFREHKPENLYVNRLAAMDAQTEANAETEIEEPTEEAPVGTGVLDGPSEETEPTDE